MSLKSWFGRKESLDPEVQDRLDRLVLTASMVGQVYWDAITDLANQVESARFLLNPEYEERGKFLLTVAAVGLAMARFPATSSMPDSVHARAWRQIETELMRSKGEWAINAYREVADLTLSCVEEAVAKGRWNPSRDELNQVIGYWALTKLISREPTEDETRAAVVLGGPVVENFANWWLGQD